MECYVSKHTRPFAETENDISSHMDSLMTTEAPRRSRMLVILFATTIFTSAFLLFQVQPLISKFILPWFGGSPAVWSTCMLFFQVTLFAGYVYAHLTTQYLSPRWQAGLHIVLLLVAALLLPITPDDAWKPAGSSSPALQIVALLTMCVGLPYFILSSTGPLLQRWFSLQAPGVSPYRLYALSNIGSLLALVSFPFVFEPILASPVQASIWSWGFRAFAIFCAACACRLFLVKNLDTLLQAEKAAEEAADENATAPSWADRATWFGLAMVASVMLLATTNQVCMDVATIPFLWILPLTLYLMSFILCFDASRWYSRKWYITLLGVTFVGVLTTLMSGALTSIILQVTAYFSALFCCCMVCHGELAQQKPSSRYLTQFYLLMSAGGAGGGLFVGLLAPYAFPAYWELHIGIVACMLITLLVLFRDRTSYLYQGRPRLTWILISLCVGVIVYSLQSNARKGVAVAVESSRNFYGVLQVRDNTNEVDDADRHCRGMTHGRIMHGTQFLAEDKQDLPTTYYGKNSGVGLVMQNHKAGQKRNIGVVGLGVGTLATYGQKDDHMRFYEINSEVIRLAKRYFTFLENSASTN